MALTRAMLKGMDIEKENIDTIIAAHTETIDGLKEERDAYKEKAEKAEELIAQYEDKKAEMIDKSEYDSLKTKYEKLKGEFEGYKEDVASKDIKAKKTEAYKALLKEAGISDKRIGVVTKATNLDSYELDETGAFKDAEKLVDAIKAEWGDFIETKSAKGAKTENPPANNGGKKMSKEDIMKIKDDTERQKAWVDYLNNQ